ncbi:MAG: hypothetical protein HKN03_18625 [Acidimicrobiales bacterium]|nr:hypothetical protein [Acidimicrobiales bacterium]
MIDVNVLLLALEDFIPVFLNAVALWLLARTCLHLDHRAGKYVVASLVLIALGGLTKPTYKMTLALSDAAENVAILDDLLFWFLAPGFVLLATGLRGAYRADRYEPARVSMAGFATASAVVVVALVFLAVGSGAWFVLLLAVATLGNLAAVAVLIRWTASQNDRLAAMLYAASLFIVFGLAWAAASLEQTIPVQWGEQLMSTASQALFLTASLRLTRRLAQPQEELPLTESRRQVGL